jgi:hypothetical protein
MGSVSPLGSEQPRCDGCLKPANGRLSKDEGDWLCRRCVAVLRAARVLLDKGIAGEDTIIPTLVFAKVAGGSQAWEALSQTGQLTGESQGLELVGIMHEANGWRPPSLDDDYAGWELVEVSDGLPIVRVLPAVAKAEPHPGTKVLKQVRIQVLSKNVKPERIAAIYEQVLAEQGAQWKENSEGVFFYNYKGFLGLTVAVGTGNLSPLTVESLDVDPLQWPAYHFPPPVLVSRIYKSLLGSLRPRKGQPKAGFEYALDNYGKVQDKGADRIITAFVAWHVGEGPGARVPPKSRPRVARFLNKHLLEKSGLLQLPENSWSSSDAVWDDVERFLWYRFVRLYAGGYATFGRV